MFSRGKNLLTIFFCTLIFTAVSFGQYYDWRPLGANPNGTNGHIYALTNFGGRLIAAGGFSSAGGVSVNNIAQWDPNTGSWSAMGSGFNDTVYALGIYNSQLYAAGMFTFSGAASVNRIALWNGTSWQPLGSGLDGEGLAIYQFGTDLIVGGDFSTAGGITVNNVARWNGSSWFSMAGGVTGSGDRVFALTYFNGNCIAAGRFQNAGGSGANNVASWNGSTWAALGQGTDDRIFAITVYAGYLVVGGDFQTAGGITAANIARWNGSTWSNVGNPYALDDNTVEALNVFNGDLIVGGGFHEVDTLYVDRITRWNGTNWFRMSTGMNDRVKALHLFNSELFAGGEFSTAGGRYCNSAAKWTNETLVQVSGTVKYVNTNINVDSGTVKILRLDVNTREVIVVNSAQILNGAYSLPAVPRDSLLRVIALPDDELDFVPTYHPSNIDWNSAIPLYTGNSLSNININVYPVTQQLLNPLAATIGGKVYLNILPPDNPPVLNAYPYWSDGIVYIRQGDLYRRFAISGTTQAYTSSALNPGTYMVYVSRLGYKSDSMQVTLGATNLDSVNFHLDTMNIIGLHNVTTRLPKDYLLKQNYPNPFNPSTVISFDLPAGGFTELKVYDILGRELAILVNGKLGKGEYKYVYNAVNLPSGIYFYTLKTDTYKETKKMILIK